MTISTNPKQPAVTHLPLVVQVGFAGARFLVDRKAHPAMDEAAISRFEKQVTAKLSESLRTEVQERMETQGPVFFCGISQVAIGGDFAFSRACEGLGWVQRIFLPQHRDAFLSAEGSKGPDFSQTQRAEAEAILGRPHIIQERLVSESNDRHQRFEEANLEIVRVANVVVVLVREDQQGKRGDSNTGHPFT